VCRLGEPEASAGSELSQTIPHRVVIAVPSPLVTPSGHVPGLTLSHLAGHRELLRPLRATITAGGCRKLKHRGLLVWF
jgi:hypothetical protein